MQNRFRKICSMAVLASLSLSLVSTVGIEANAMERKNGIKLEGMTQEKIDAANNKYNNAATNVEFITMADTEFGGRPEDVSQTQQVSYESNNWVYKRIADWTESKNFNTQGIMGAGDVVGANEPEYYDHLKGEDRLVQGWYRAVDQVLSENFGEDVYVMLANGNHDIADILGETMDENHKGDDKWFYGNKENNYVSNSHVKINGYDFITLDYNGPFHFGYANNQNGYQKFLKETMDKITQAEDYDATKPIFVQAHSGYEGTSLGGEWASAYDMMGPDLQNILNDYPQVLMGSGHTHFSMGGEFGISQENLTFYENQSMNYMYMDTPSSFVEGGYFDSNTGNEQYTAKACNLISVLEDGTTVIRRYDVTNNRWMGMPWIVDTKQGKEGFNYTKEKRSKIAPWFTEDAKVTTSDVTETSLILGFDQAFDDEQVNNYSVKITEESSGNPVPVSVRQLPDKSNKEGKIFNSGEFRAYSRYYYRPNIMSFEIKNLEPGQTYKVEVYGYDDFENKSEEPLVGSIKTSGRLSLPEVDGPINLPENIDDDMIFDMNFENNLTDSIGQTEAIANGDISYVDSYHNNKGTAVNIEKGNKNYIDLGNREEWNLGTDKNLSVNFWTKVNSHSGYSSILSNKSWSSYTKEGINLAPRAGDASTMELSLGDGQNGQYAFASVGSYIGEWHMMSLTINRENQTANIYMDGKKVNTASIASIGSMTSGSNMYLGIDASKSYGTMGFYMDDLDMWSRALNDDDIKALYNASSFEENEKLLQKAIGFAEVLQIDINNQISKGRVYDEEMIRKFEKILNEAKKLEDAEQYLAYYMELKNITDEINSSIAKYKVEASAENGTITPDINVVESGDSVIFNLNPNEGYHIEESQIAITPSCEYTLDGTKLTVNNITQGIGVSVKFIKDTIIERVAVQASAENGTITPSSLEVEVGGSVIFELKPNEGYTIEGARIEVSPNSEFTIKDGMLIIEDVNEELNVKVSFAKEEEKEDDKPSDNVEDDKVTGDKDDSSSTNKPENGDSTNNTVQTGDKTNVLVYMAVLFISSIATIVIKRK